MSQDELDYDSLVENAMRGVVREALARVAESGLPGEHHFYITFKTDHPGVAMADHLRAQFPHEITVVLQYQFWDLSVEPDHFQVTLSFSNRPERLVVPFEAVSAFVDPSVDFGLQFDRGRGQPGVQDNEANEATEASAEAEAEAEVDVEDADDKADDSAGGAEKVVNLDAFRKK